ALYPTDWKSPGSHGGWANLCMHEYEKAGKIVVAKRLVEITISFNMPCFHTFFSISKAINRFYCWLMAFVFALKRHYAVFLCGNTDGEGGSAPWGAVR
ncbi:hypothetical protein, partial [Eubacterium aggregans]|uniref:hypothetical protein n=1 Tax=Eubacterium aggregans TaxID=81409 RepID=UPI003F2F3B01